MRASKRLANDERLHEAQKVPHVGDLTKHGGVEAKIKGRLIPSYPSYLDRYYSGALAMHLHFGLRGPSDGGREDDLLLCAILHVVTLDGRVALVDEHVIDPCEEHSSLNAASNGNKLTMLIGVFETAYDAEGVSVAFVQRHVVRLKSINDCPGTIGESADGNSVFFPRFAVANEILAVRALFPDVFQGDGHTRALPLLRWNGSDNDMVECAAKVVYEVTQDYGDHRIRLLSDLQAVEPSVRMALRLPPDGDNLIRVTVGVEPSIALDFHHVMLCPLDLEPPTLMMHEVRFNLWTRRRRPRRA